MILGVQEIENIIPHRFPMLLIDRILELEEGRRGVGIKNLTYNESFFQGHFPGNPIMPGVLIIECMAQVAAITLSSTREYKEAAKEKKNIINYLLTVEKVKFKRPVIPGDTMLIEMVVLKRLGGLARVKGEVKIGDKIAALGELTVGNIKKDG